MTEDMAVDTKFLDEALDVSGLKTTTDTINLALKEFIERRKQREIIALFGKLPQDNDYNYKKYRIHTLTI